MPGEQSLGCQAPNFSLFKLAYACKIYTVTSQFDDDYRALLDVIDTELDFDNEQHLQALLDWLNAWGCRQFAVEYHPLAKQSIRAWAEEWEKSLPDVQATADQLTEDVINRIGGAYDDLSRRLASYRRLGASKHPVTIGPTGSAKILFAARPNAIAPWDNAIRSALKHGRDGESFAAYTRSVKSQIQQVTEEASKFPISAAGIAAELGRPNSSLPKLIDEYNFVTYTRRVKYPDASELSRWLEWCPNA